jgi:hypothetical protein
VATDELTVLLDRAIEVHVGFAQQAGLKLADEDVELAPCCASHAALGFREPVPGLGERQKRRASARLVGHQHRADAAFAVDVGAHDDPLVALNAVEHRLAGGDGQAVDRQTQILDWPGAVMCSICHRLCSCRTRPRRAAGCAPNPRASVPFRQ